MPFKETRPDRPYGQSLCYAWKKLEYVWNKNYFFKLEGKWKPLFELKMIFYGVSDSNIEALLSLTHTSPHQKKKRR